MSTCANLGVVASLLIAATRQSTIGRPIPMKASAGFGEAFGGSAAEVLLTATFASNALTECLALLTVIISVVGRLILTNIMPSLISKLEFLASSNLNGNLVLCVVYLLISLVNTLALAGALSSSSFGFVVTGLAPITMGVAAKWCMPHYLKACLRVRLEAQQIIQKRSQMERTSTQLLNIACDEDGRISLEDLKKGLPDDDNSNQDEAAVEASVAVERFEGADTDGDGKVTVEEYRLWETEAIRTMKAQTSPGRLDRNSTSSSDALAAEESSLSRDLESRATANAEAEAAFSSV